MNILAIDTSTKDLLMAVQCENQTTHSVSTQSLQHSKILFTDLESLLEKAGIDKTKIDVIAVNLGPGSFTGIRIGVVFAKGMAYALGTKLVSADAFTCVASERKDLLPAGIICEERNGGGYFAIAKEENGEVEISHRGVYKSEEIEKLMQKENIQNLLCSSENKIGAQVVSGINGLLEIANKAIQKGDFNSIEQLEPVYIKKSQAEEQLEEKLKKISENK
ncbi:MAG: tRNA (adenosine(37)-N6)-threonylcarbamoyltransferase complex dimerization subunit type 1 TsaB [Bacillota bacterium]